LVGLVIMETLIKLDTKCEFSTRKCLPTGPYGETPGLPVRARTGRQNTGFCLPVRVFLKSC
jgi:hypothetical protein